MFASQRSSISIHPDTFLRSDQLGSFYPEYRPTFSIPGGFLNAHHRFLATAVNPGNGGALLTAPGLLDHTVGSPIQGWLRIQDALKLYELAYCCVGEILELGTYEGLSTCIMAQAVRDAGRPGRITTIDIEPRAAARLNARYCGVDTVIDFRIGDAVQVVAELPRPYGFIFVDHSHTYQHVSAACALQAQLVAAHGFVLFHDYNDPRNGTEPDYGVYQAVADALPSEQFEFCGVYGCSALYRNR
jgi:hypothetical protein